VNQKQHSFGFKLQILNSLWDLQFSICPYNTGAYPEGARGPDPPFFAGVKTGLFELNPAARISEVTVLDSNLRCTFLNVHFLIVFLCVKCLRSDFCHIGHFKSF